MQSSKNTKTVLVTGANGYIGRAVACAFKAEGYKVYGIVRTEEKVKSARLVAEEIIPIVADPNNPESFQKYIDEAGIIIENASMTDKPEFIQNIVAAVEKSGKCEDNSNKLYIQTTGIKQYAHEHLVLENKNIVGSVVRPAFIYGGASGPVQRWYFFNKPQDGKFKTGAKKTNVWPWCNIHDLAHAYVLIAQNKQKVQGQLFRVGEHNKEYTYEKVVKAHCKAMNVEIEYIPEPVNVEKFFDFNVDTFDNESTKKILNWVPKHSGDPTEDIELQYAAFLFWQKEGAS